MAHIYKQILLKEMFWILGQFHEDFVFEEKAFI